MADLSLDSSDIIRQEHNNTLYLRLANDLSIYAFPDRETYGRFVSWRLRTVDTVPWRVVSETDIRAYPLGPVLSSVHQWHDPYLIEKTNNWSQLMSGATFVTLR